MIKKRMRMHCTACVAFVLSIMPPYAIMFLSSLISTRKCKNQLDNVCLIEIITVKHELSTATLTYW